MADDDHARYTYDVFLSHNRQDKPWVRELAYSLHVAGLKVFFDEEAVPPGAQILRTIEDALEDSRYILLFLTPFSLASRWVALEVALAISADPDSKQNRLIPVCLEPLNLKDIRPSLRALNIINLADSTHRNERFVFLMKYLGLNAEVIPMPPTWPQTTAVNQPVVRNGSQARETATDSHIFNRNLTFEDLYKRGEGDKKAEERFNLLGQIPRSLLRLLQRCYGRWHERLST